MGKPKYLCLMQERIDVSWCVLIYTPFIRPKPDLKDQKLTKICQENVCFCICVCVGTDMWKMDKNKPKTDKNEHEIGKR
jgi:hypothetical protein